MKRHHRPAWRRRRVLLPALALVALGAALAGAILRSNRSRIVLYNQTGEPLALLRLSACGQSTVVRDLPDEGSFRWKLNPAGSASDIEVELATDPPRRWRGSYVEPRGGYRVTLRIWPDGQVEEFVQISIWQRWSGRAPEARE